MKKSFYILLVLVATIIVLMLWNQKSIQELPTLEPTNTVSPQQPTPTTIESHPYSPPATEHSQPTNESPTELTNALTATNLEQWTNAIIGLKKLGGFTLDQHWLVEQNGRTNGIPITLSFGNKTIQYKAVLISILAKNETGNIMEVEMQTQNMSIDETRELGLQICDMLNIDPKGFLAWCDKVGNNWLDQPLFGDGDGRHHYSFHLLHAYDDKKPWIINFMIIPNP